MQRHAPPSPEDEPAGAHRLARRVRALAIADLAFGGVAAVAAVLAFVTSANPAEPDPNSNLAEAFFEGLASGLVTIFMLIYVILLVPVAALSLAAGVALLRRARQGRGLGLAAAVAQVVFGSLTLAIVVGLLPLGAGIYGLAVLGRRQAGPHLAG